MKPRAVVFAYHNVGVRCLQVLLARGVDVALVVTHEDNPNENIWFGSVASVRGGTWHRRHHARRSESARTAATP